MYGSVDRWFGGLGLILLVLEKIEICVWRMANGEWLRCRLWWCVVKLRTDKMAKDLSLHGVYGRDFYAACSQSFRHPPANPYVCECVHPRKVMAGDKRYRTLHNINGGRRTQHILQYDFGFPHDVD